MPLINRKGISKTMNDYEYANSFVFFELPFVFVDDVFAVNQRKADLQLGARKHRQVPDLRFVATIRDQTSQRQS